MVDRNQKTINHINMFLDACLIFLSYFISVKVRFVILNGVLNINFLSSRFLVLIAIYSLVIMTVFSVFKMYGSYKFKNYIKEIITIFVINGIGVAFLTTILFITRTDDFSRFVLFMFWFFSSTLMIAKRIFFRNILTRYHKFGYKKKRIVVIGNGIIAEQFIEDILQNPQMCFEVIGYIGEVGKRKLGKRLGAYEELEKIISEYDVDEVVVALEPHETKFVDNIFSVADKEGVGLRIIPFYNNYFPKNATVDLFGNTKLINVRVTPLDNIGLAFIKRVMDIFGSMLALIIFSPIMIIVAIGVKLSSPGPIFFMQDRVGLNKKPFKMYKFRSMRMNNSETTGWSKNIDPRKTKFGSFIRKYSLDELPQLINVLKGDMSLVGPRPEIPFYVAKFKEDVPLYLLRQHVKPGMTGWAQINGLRGDTSIEDRVKYDLWYIQNWNLWLDIKILFRTLFGGLKNNEIINI